MNEEQSGQRPALRPFLVGGHTECHDAIETLYQFLDGQLDDQRRKVIQQHLDDCAPCLGAFDFETELRSVIARKCRDQVPESLRSRVFQALREASEFPQGPDLGQGMPSL